MTTVAVIGGGAAGMSAASRARRINKDSNITVFERSSFVSYSSCGIPYFIEGLVDNVEELITYTPEFFRKERNIDVHTNAVVDGIDLSSRTLTYYEGEARRVFEWDKLIIASGAEPIRPRIDGTELGNIFTVRFLEDALKVKAAAEKARNVVVVGGGYIGIEMAEAFSAINKKVTVVEMLPHILSNLDPEMSEIVERKLLERGLSLRLGERVVEFKGEGSVEKVVTSQGVYDADLVMLGVGVKPSVELAKKIGLRLGATGAIDAEKTMVTSVEDVYAAGDCVETTHLVTGERAWIPLGPSANKMGYIAGGNVFGNKREFPGILGTAFTKAFDLQIAVTGLTETSAKKKGIEVSSALIRARSRALYYPEVEELALKLISDKDTGRLLGAQCIGREGAVERINVVAALLCMNAKVKNLFFTDLGYAPPYAPVWDPLVTASRVTGFDSGI